LSTANSAFCAAGKILIKTQADKKEFREIAGGVRQKETGKKAAEEEDGLACSVSHNKSYLSATTV